MEKNELNSKSRIQSSLNRVKNIRSMDLKKVSPYVNSNPNLRRNDKILKAQKVIEMEHKFRVAHKEYEETSRKRKEDPINKKQSLHQEWSSEHK